MTEKRKTFLKAGLAASSTVAVLQCLIEIAGLSLLYNGYIFRPQDLYKSQAFLLFRKIMGLGKHSSMPFFLDHYLGPEWLDKFPLFLTIIGTYATLSLVAGILLGVVLHRWASRKSLTPSDIYRIAFSFALSSWLPLNAIVYSLKVAEKKGSGISEQATTFLIATIAGCFVIWILYKIFSRLFRKWIPVPGTNPVFHYAPYGMVFLALCSSSVNIWNSYHRDYSVKKDETSAITTLVSKPQTNVILISIDSLRPDHLSSYGYSRNTSPNIDELARDGVLFRNAFSSTTWTFSAHRTLLTSTFPEATDTLTYMDQLPSNLVTLAEVFARNGYSTAAFVSTDLLDSKYGFNQGFRLYDDFTVSYDQPLDAHINVTTPTLHHAVQNWLNANSKDNFFLFLHYWDVHYDYNPPPPYDVMFDPEYKGSMDSRNFIKNAKINKKMDPKDLAHILSLYDGEIAFTDHFIGQLVGILRQAQIYDRTLIVITADHGDEFFEHGYKGHMRTLYDEVLRIPLIIKFPEGTNVPRNQIVDQVVSIADVMPTVLDSLKMRGPSEMQGRNLVPAIKGIRDPEHSFVYASLRNEMFALRSAKSKLIQRSNFPKKEFYDLEKDPFEQKNVSKNEIAESDRQIRMLLDFLNLQRKYLRSRFLIKYEAASMEDSLKEQMKALGYVQ